jgi:branched-chain amino acid transport system substrate-binding protein
MYREIRPLTSQLLRRREPEDMVCSRYGTNRFLSHLAHGSVVTTLVITLSLAACDRPSPSRVSGDNKRLILATELPIAQPAEHDVGIAAQNGAALAVQDNSDLGGGYHLAFKPYDDSTPEARGHDPKKGLANIEDIVKDPQIIAVIGPYNSNVAEAEIPIVNNSNGPVLISPANTNPGLTLRDQASANGIDFDQLHPAHHKDFYFRIPSNDLVQGRLLANICLASTALKGIGAKSAFVLHDNQVYGIGLAKAFSDAFTAGGGTLVAAPTLITRDQTATFSDLAARIVSLHPDVIFFGGNPGAGAGELKQAVAAAGAANTLWVVGSGIVNHSSWFSEAGTAAAGIFGTVAGPDLKTLSSASTFVAQYRSAFKTDPLPYSAFAFDSAMMVISAIKAIIASGQSVTREAIRARIAASSYTGAAGRITFDAHGDNTGSNVFSVWAVLPTSATKWSLEQNVDARFL